MLPSFAAEHWVKPRDAGQGVHAASCPARPEQTLHLCCSLSAGHCWLCGQVPWQSTGPFPGPGPRSLLQLFRSGAGFLSLATGSFVSSPLSLTFTSCHYIFVIKIWVCICYVIWPFTNSCYIDTTDHFKYIGVVWLLEWLIQNMQASTCLPSTCSGLVILVLSHFNLSSRPDFERGMPTIFRNETTLCIVAMWQAKN